MIDLGEQLGLIVVDTDAELVVPYCHITPLDCGSKTLYVVTDLHPNVLSTTTIDQENEAVMYIGPDSLALVDHWASAMEQNVTTTHKVVDFCTGSGIQAIAVATRTSPSSEITCVDLNPRALRIAGLNFALNGLSPPTLVLGDLQDQRGGKSLDATYYRLWQDIVGQPTMILANPPFLPVPVEDSNISKRHGLFSCGGASGEDILERIVVLASQSLAPEGTLAIVSEFMNPRTTFEKRLRQWWGTRPARGLLFVNEQAMDVETYSMNRADSPAEFNTWLSHLNHEEITHVSPGLLFVRGLSECTGLSLETILVPKTEHGSIWTPFNVHARQLSRRKLEMSKWVSHRTV
jgi:tRNA1(Val) A37 N6-methylase TrmN6